MHPIPEAAPKGGMPLHVKVLLGFALGAVIGLLVHAQGLEHTALVESLIAWVTKPFGQIFLNLLFMLVVPLMFSALVLGVAELGDIASLGRLGWRTLIYTAASPASRSASAC
jgi:DAACS family dicarboxylate/amino acid:cation (Na+ or H+) symporter